MPTLHIFCIPGLGLSWRFFDHLGLQNGELNYLNWIEPKGWESIEEYAHRISEPLREVGGDVVLIGHSFGGVIAQQIARIQKVKAIILISSMVHPDEAPGRLRLLETLGLHRFITKGLILGSFPIWARTHSYRTKELRQLFRESVKSLSSHYFQWSLLRIATWTGIQEGTASILRIHGDKDMTFRFNKIEQVDHVISGGDHNMVYLKGGEISVLINKHLQAIRSAAV